MSGLSLNGSGLSLVDPGGGSDGGYVDNKTGDYQVLLTDNPATFTITGAAGDVDFTLPAGATAGQSFQFVVTAAHLLTINANAGATIALGEALSSVAGSVSADGADGGLNAVIALKALSATAWVATTSFGPWSVA